MTAAVRKFRLWVADDRDRTFEVLKVPAPGLSEPRDFLFTTDECRVLENKLAKELRFSVRAIDEITNDDLIDSRFKLLGPEIDGEADLYFDCSDFLAMSIDTT